GQALVVAVAAGGVAGRDPGQAGERRFAAQPVGVVPGGGQQLAGGVGAEAVEGHGARGDEADQRAQSGVQLAPAGRVGAAGRGGGRGEAQAGGGVQQGGREGGGGVGLGLAAQARRGLGGGVQGGAVGDQGGARQAAQVGA